MFIKIRRILLLAVVCFLGLCKTHTCTAMRERDFFGATVSLGKKQVRMLEPLKQIITEQAARFLRDGELSVFDGRTGDLQCQIRAMMTYETYKAFRENGFDLDLLSEDEKNYLYLSFFLGRCFGKYVNRRKQAFAELLGGAPGRLLNLFANESVMEPAKQCLTVMTLQYVRRLTRELVAHRVELLGRYQVACERLGHVFGETDIVEQMLDVLGELSTFNYSPQFFGIIVVFLKSILKGYPLYLQAKVVGAHGYNYFFKRLAFTMREINDDEPVIIVNGGTFMGRYAAYKRLRDRCVHNVSLSQPIRHHDSCCHCILVDPEADAFISHAISLLDDHCLIRYVLCYAAKYTYDNQAEKRRFFTFVGEGDQDPDSLFAFICRQLFEQPEMHAQEPGITLFAIEHLYADSLRNVLERMRLGRSFNDSLPLELIRIYKRHREESI